MKFRTKEDLFRDIPAQGNSVTSKNYSHTTDSFARWYYEEGLSDGAERSAKGLDPYSDHFSESCKSNFPNALREAIDRYLNRKGPLVNFPEPEVLSILVGGDMIHFNIFQADGEAAQGNGESDQPGEGKRTV